MPAITVLLGSALLGLACSQSLDAYESKLSAFWSSQKLGQKSAGASTFFTPFWGPTQGSGHGYATRPEDGATMATADTPFMLASVSKTITFTALTILMDRGHFDLDDDVSEALGRPLRNPHFPQQAITYRMLYTHRSGMRDLVSHHLSAMYAPKGTDIGGGDTATGESSCPVDSISEFMEEWIWGIGNTGIGGVSWYTGAEGPWLKLEPGSKYRYSNMGAAFVAYLVEQISGMTFTDFVRKEIFVPLGMTSTAWWYEELPVHAQAKASLPYQRKGNRFVSGGRYCFVDYPNGGLWSTAHDVGKFDLAVARFGLISSGGQRLYSHETGKRALTCADDVFPNSKCEFALGWGLEKPATSSVVGRFMREEDDGICYTTARGVRECKVPMHDGSETGVTTISLLNPNKGYVLGLLANSEVSDAVLGKLANEALRTGLAVSPSNAMGQGTCSAVASRYGAATCGMKCYQVDECNHWRHGIETGLASLCPALCSGDGGAGSGDSGSAPSAYCTTGNKRNCRRLQKLGLCVLKGKTCMDHPDNEPSDACFQAKRRGQCNILAKFGLCAWENRKCLPSQPTNVDNGRHNQISPSPMTWWSG